MMATLALPAPRAVTENIPIWRLYLLRGSYLLIAAGMGMQRLFTISVIPAKRCVGIAQSRDLLCGFSVGPGARFARPG